MNTIKTRKWNEWATYFDMFLEELRYTACDYKRKGVLYYHNFVMHGAGGVKYTTPVNLRVSFVGDYRYTDVKIGKKWVNIFDDSFDLEVL
jgi:hypothetical protein